MSIQGGQYQLAGDPIYSNSLLWGEHQSAVLEPASDDPQGIGRGGQQRPFSRQPVLQPDPIWDDTPKEGGTVQQLLSRRSRWLPQPGADLGEIDEVTERVSPWDKVLKALEDPMWDFRTVESIARETSLDPSHVRTLLDMHKSELRNPVFPDREGRKLFTARSRLPGWREIVHTIQRCVSKSL